MLRLRRSAAVFIGFLFFLVLGRVQYCYGAGTVQGTAHDFRSPENGGPNTNYPILAEMAGSNPCAVCHASHSAVFARALFANDFGWEPSRKIKLPSSGLCMGCHNGELKTEAGTEIIAHPDLRIAERHRRHRVEYPYPGREGHLPTYAPVEKDERGRYWAIGTNGYRLPLDYDQKTDQTKAGCITCHNPHNPGVDNYYLRTKYPQELCWACHSSTGKRVEE